MEVVVEKIYTVSRVHRKKWTARSSGYANKPAMKWNKQLICVVFGRYIVALVKAESLKKEEIEDGKNVLPVLDRYGE